MKLMFDLPNTDEEVLQQNISPDEKRMYCLPYNFEGEEKVEGFMVFTDKHIYKILNGNLLKKYTISEMSDFSVETHYGSCGFYAKINGNDGISLSFQKQNTASTAEVSDNKDGSNSTFVGEYTDLIEIDFEEVQDEKFLRLNYKTENGGDSGTPTPPPHGGETDGMPTPPPPGGNAGGGMPGEAAPEAVDLPQTGDTQSILLYAALMALAAGAVMMLRRRKA